MNILLVEDESSLSHFLSESLKKEGYCVQPVTSMEELNSAIEQKVNPDPQVIVLDRLLHGLDSSEKITTLKDRFPSSKIIVLSAIGGPTEKGKILDLGADDYVSKPFSIEELIARIRVSQRYNVKTAQTVQAYGNLTLNLFSQSAEVDGKKLELSKKEYQLLTALLHTPTKVFNRYQLLDSIWDIHADVESNVVEVTIKNLRKKLESVQANVEILSKRNVGYWIEI
jgi:two-component system OmpR family response regulator